ncbi:MAG: glycosyltransferase, partial [Desulfosarcina sp.]
ECKWMKRQGHRTLLVAPVRSQVYTRTKSAALNVFPLSFTNLTAVTDFFRLRNLLKKVAPHVLNTHGNMDAKVGLMAARGLGIPCVIRSRHHSHPVSASWHNQWMYRNLSEYIFTSAQGISDQISRDLAVDPSKVITVASGIIPPDRLIDRDAAVGRLQRELDLDSSARFVGSVAMLRDWKGHRYLIDGFKIISQRFPHHHLIIVGEGHEMESLKLQRERHGLIERIHFTGYRENPWPFYRAFDLNVLASTKNEAVSQTLPQAMYAGCPVIGTRAGGIPEIIEDGKTGLLVEPEDAIALANAMAAVLDHPDVAAESARRAYEHVSQNHTIDTMGRRILGLYEAAFSRVE